MENIDQVQALKALKLYKSDFIEGKNANIRSGLQSISRGEPYENLAHYNYSNNSSHLQGNTAGGDIGTPEIKECSHHMENANITFRTEPSRQK
ncbi:unnamed protein product, partial [Dovyalis caffra]